MSINYGCTNLISPDRTCSTAGIEYIYKAQSSTYVSLFCTLMRVSVTRATSQSPVTALIFWEVDIYMVLTNFIILVGSNNQIKCAYLKMSELISILNQVKYGIK